jgi:hypothetical protein
MCGGLFIQIMSEDFSLLIIFFIQFPLSFSTYFLLLCYLIQNQEPRAKSQEPRAKNQEPRTKSKELRKNIRETNFCKLLCHINLLSVYIIEK